MSEESKTLKSYSAGVALIRQIDFWFQQELDWGIKHSFIFSLAADLREHLPLDHYHASGSYESEVRSYHGALMEKYGDFVKIWVEHEGLEKLVV